jgi:phage/plasmid-associated DNA primase
MIKKENPDELKIWNNKYNNNDKDFYDKLELMNQNDFAKIYFDLYPTKYIVSKSKQWYEYNEYNILINQNGIPSSLKNNISNILQNIIIEKRNELKPDDAHYKFKNQLIVNAYKNVGCSSYTKGIIEYLEFLYIKIDLDDLLDNNVNLLAFNNKVYDIYIKNFRDIKPDDYITKTTKINMPTKYDEANEKKIFDLLLEIFDSKENYEYWLKTTALSLFGNKYESCYILTGTGGNGKGLLSKILIKLFGDYLYTANNTFLTEKIKAGGANSTLANCKGVRYLLICEPDDGNDAEFNVEFIKAITGGDNITTRDLFKTNITYTPQFTPFIQCNKNKMITIFN